MTPRAGLMVIVASATCARPVPSRPALVSADDARAVLARFRAVTGGSAWDAVVELRGDGTFGAGGLGGPAQTIDDVTTGRYTLRDTLGPVTIVSGFDGSHWWQVDPGGEVRSFDAAGSLARARTDAWVRARAFWYPARGAATYGALEYVVDTTGSYAVVTATPDGGIPIAMWFEIATGLLVRTVEQLGTSTVVTTIDDYRAVGGVRIAFHLAAASTDADGSSDPRDATDLRLSRVERVDRVDAAAFAVPTMAPTARIDDPSGTTRVPFELVENHIHVVATVDGRPVHVLFDTGGSNVVTPGVAQQLGLATTGKFAGQGVGEGHVDVALARGGELRLGAAVLDRPVFYIIDLGAISDTDGVDTDGFIGFELFRRFRVSIDYAARALTLVDPARFTPPANAHVVPFEFEGHIPVIEATLDGLPVRLAVDTGSRTSLSMHSPFVRDHDLIARYHAAAETVTGWGIGGPSRGRPARFGTLAIGDVVVPDIAGDLFTGDKGAFADPGVSGNLGGGVLRRFAVTFDYDAKRMYLVPNAELATSEAYDRSGMMLFHDRDALNVMAVAPDSAAAQAGVAVGDRVVRIDDESISARAPAQWRARLRELPVGTRVKLAVERGGARVVVTITLADRIPAHAPPGET